MRCVVPLGPSALKGTQWLRQGLVLHGACCRMPHAARSTHSSCRSCRREFLGKGLGSSVVRKSPLTRNKGQHTNDVLMLCCRSWLGCGRCRPAR